jgi:hypothetical protein
MAMMEEEVELVRNLYFSKVHTGLTVPFLAGNPPETLRSKIMHGRSHFMEIYLPRWSQLRMVAIFARFSFVLLLLAVPSQAWIRVDDEPFGTALGRRDAYEGEPNIHFESARIKEEEVVFSARVEP